LQGFGLAFFWAQGSAGAVLPGLPQHHNLKR
jgi:hypothetical protein